MKRIMPMKIRFVLVESPDSKKRLQTAYNRIFVVAKQNLVNKAQKRESKI